MDKPLNTVAFTKAFLSQADDEGMGQAERDALVQLLATDPMAGDLIVGSGGCRKVRIARRGGGRSGGFRVVTFFAPRNMPVYVIAVLAKGTRANFSKAEVNEMNKLADRILAANPIREAG